MMRKKCSKNKIFKLHRHGDAGHVIISTVMTAALVAALTFVPKGEVYATTQQQINQTQAEKELLEAQQRENEAALNELRTQHGELMTRVGELSGELENISDNLALLEAAMIEKQAEIEATRIALDEAIATEEWQYECMVIRVRDMYERGDQDFISALLGAKSLSDMLTAADFFEKIEQYDQRKLQEFKDNRAFIAEQKERLELEEAELEELIAQQQAEQDKVTDIIAQTRDTITVYSGQIEDG